MRGGERDALIYMVGDEADIVEAGISLSSPTPTPFTSAYTAGITISVRTVEDTMPPIIGTAMRCMISEPVPWLQRMGSKPAMMATTVIIFGRTRSTAPSITAP